MAFDLRPVRAYLRHLARGGQSGAAMLVAVACLLGFIIFIAVLGADIPTGQKANVAAQFVADEVINEVRDIFKLTSTQSAIISAVNAPVLQRGGVVEKAPKGGAVSYDNRFRVTRLDLIVPPIAEVFPPTSASDLVGGVGSYTFAAWSAAFGVSALTCPPSANGNCHIYTDVSTPDNYDGIANGADDFTPPGLWALRDGGAHFGVIVEVEASTLFLRIAGTRRVTGRGKAVVSVVHRNRDGLLNNPDPGESNQPSYIIGFDP
ncbi:MAG: hypothetical protein KDD70_16560, partial [Bdellovibrionales bacterium]|nr:hypothetical protein [Bdellovibrionales bacterium]